MKGKVNQIDSLEGLVDILANAGQGEKHNREVINRVDIKEDHIEEFLTKLDAMHTSDQSALVRYNFWSFCERNYPETKGEDWAVCMCRATHPSLVQYKATEETGDGADLH